ncbi:UDP-glycosyltransferase 78D2 [Platanthera zijinensis]|uniref:UDP-glycosyltransferase 78D2 n=1 Tax=Platanthera zijinensis TaxID=2320716 RepID=A0AAP0FW60_9ASPA
MQQHIVLFSNPIGVSAGQLHGLARALAAAVPEAIFSFVGNRETLILLPREPMNLRLIPFEGGIPNGAEPSPELLLTRFLTVGPENYMAMLNTAEANADGLPVTCVISDAFMWVTQSVAKEKMLPWIAFYSGFSLAMLAHIHTDDLRSRFRIDEAGMAALSQEALDFIPGFATMRVCDLPNGILFGGIDSAFALLVNGMGTILPRADMVVLPSFAGSHEELDSLIFAKLNLALLIGPVHLLSPPPPSADREGCVPWLNDRPALSVVYICFGAFITLPPTELAEVAHGLEDSQVSFLWSIKEEFRSFLPEGFVERTRAIGKLVSCAPQLCVLNHPAVAVSVTRSGWKDALESISAGVPMLCRPFHGDRRMVARALQEIWGAGVKFDGPINRWSFARAMEGIMRGSDGKRMRQCARVLRKKTMEEMLPGRSLSNNFDVLVEFLRGDAEDDCG